MQRNGEEDKVDGFGRTTSGSYPSDDELDEKGQKKHVSFFAFRE